MNTDGTVDVVVVVVALPVGFTVVVDFGTVVVVALGAVVVRATVVATPSAIC